jgi:hypothetical protein
MLEARRMAIKRINALQKNMGRTECGEGSCILDGHGGAGDDNASDGLVRVEQALVCK